MTERDEVIGKAVEMVNKFKESKSVFDQLGMGDYELELRVTKYLMDFRLIGETALFFGGYAGVNRLLNAIDDAGGDSVIAERMLEGIVE